MPYKAVLNGEELVSGKASLEIVCEMMKLEFTRPGSRTVAGFMKHVAKRTRDAAAS